jgi:hypothetical protein
MEKYEIIAGGEPCAAFDGWIVTLRQAGIQAAQIPVADYDRKRGHNPNPHPRGNENYVLVPIEKLEAALEILNRKERE